ncbi:hypothetical protein H5A44_10155 [Pectobacterium brasiliense]|uniref:hypothetical protein n=1 Tax=Pectobacterium brasiliense TaxID=180957 RepID=UPI001969CFA5|nr:hypothetical protein [Pectobacterium brasiliense]MBN3342792.1 hypothetical protein [Pectobacterium brasiliense]
MRLTFAVFLLTPRTRPTKGGSIAVALGTLAFLAGNYAAVRCLREKHPLCGPPLTRSRRGIALRGIHAAYPRVCLSLSIIYAKENTQHTKPSKNNKLHNRVSAYVFTSYPFIT